MSKQILQTLSPLLACLFLAGCNIYTFPDQTPATPVQPVYYYGYKPPIQPVYYYGYKPPIQQLKPVHGTGYKPPIAPINPPINNVTPSHAATPVVPTNPPVNNVAPSHVTIATPTAPAKAIDKKKKPALDSDVN